MLKKEPMSEVAVFVSNIGIFCLRFKERKSKVGVLSRKTDEHKLQNELYGL